MSLADLDEIQDALEERGRNRKRIAELEAALGDVLHEWTPHPDEYIDGGANGTSYRLAKAVHDRAYVVLRSEN